MSLTTRSRRSSALGHRPAASGAPAAPSTRPKSRYRHSVRGRASIFEAIQRVRPPPGRGAARQPEASLAWAAATSLVKRRQRMLKPCVSLDIMYPLRPSVWVDRGRRRQGRQRRGLAGSAGVLELGKGMGRIARRADWRHASHRAHAQLSRDLGAETQRSFNKIDHMCRCVDCEWVLRKARPRRYIPRHLASHFELMIGGRGEQ